MIVPMKRLTLVALKAEQEAIMSALQEISAVHVIPQADEAGEQSRRLIELENELRRIENSHRLAKQYGQKPKMGPRPLLEKEQLYSELQRSEELCLHMEELDQQMNRLKAEIDKRRLLVNQLLPFAALETPIQNVRSTKNIHIMAGLTDQRGLAALESLGDTLGVELGVDVYPYEQGISVLLAMHTQDKKEVTLALKDISFTEYSFPDLTGTVSENIGRLNAEISALQNEQEGIRAQLSELSVNRSKLEMAYDALHIELDREETKKSLFNTNSAFVLDGWVREDQVELVESTIAKVTDAYYTEFRDPMDDEIPPSELKNPKIIQPYELITNMYSRPYYRGIDATPLMAPFYWLFFGMMMADTGYGLLLAIGGLIFKKVMRPRGKLTDVIIQCGVSTAIVGLLMGSFFGVAWPDILGEGIIFPLIDPLSNVLPMILICCGLGIFQMMVGLGIKAYMCFKSKDWQSAVFDNISWMLFVLGLVGLLGSGMVEGMPWLKTVATVMAATGAGLLLLFTGRDKKNPFKRLISGFGAIYNVTGYLGDTLSYVRILALGLVGGAMGTVFNIIVKMIFTGFSSLGIIGMILGAVLAGAVFAALHGFSLFINTLGSYVHCARLQYVEYFGKFYESNGLEFKPLGYRSKFVDIKQKN